MNETFSAETLDRQAAVIAAGGLSGISAEWLERALRQAAQQATEIAALRKNTDYLEQCIAAMQEKLDALAPHESCACSYDRPGDVCFHHSPKLAQAEEQVATLTRERDGALDEWRARYDTPPWRSLERMYRETYPGRDVVASDVLRWADTFIAARRHDLSESLEQLKHVEAARDRLYQSFCEMEHDRDDQIRRAEAAERALADLRATLTAQSVGPAGAAAKRIEAEQRAEAAEAALDSLRGASERPARAQWESIESAPKDGTPILLRESERVDVGHWFKGDEYGGWWAVHAIRWHPTHWAPLPVIDPRTSEER